MIVWALVVWFGSGNTQSSFAVSNIASAAECQRLGDEMAKGKMWPQVRCYPYRAAR